MDKKWQFIVDLYFIYLLALVILDDFGQHSHGKSPI